MIFYTYYFFRKKKWLLWLGKQFWFGQPILFKQTHLSEVSHKTMYCFLEHLGSRDKVMLSAIEVTDYKIQTPGSDKYLTLCNLHH